MLYHAAYERWVLQFAALKVAYFLSYTSLKIICSHAGDCCGLIIFFLYTVSPRNKSCLQIRIFTVDSESALCLLGGWFIDPCSYAEGCLLYKIHVLMSM